MEGGADNGVGIGGDLTSAPHANCVITRGMVEPDAEDGWCMLKAVQKAAKEFVVRLRASTYPFKRKKKITKHTRSWDPERQEYIRSFGKVVEMYPGRIRRHMRRDRKSLFISKPFTWAACYSFPESERVFWSAPALALEHHPITYYYIPFCAAPIPSLLCSAVESRDGAADVGRAVLAD